MSYLDSYFEKLDVNNKLSHSFLIGNISYDDIEEDLLNVINKYFFKDLKNIKENPDLYILKPEDSIVSKDDIKDLLKSITTTSQFNNNKVYIIDKSEKLSDYAYNAILKTLEEPKDNIYAFLLTTNIDAVKPTIVSRCQKIFISSSKKEEKFEDNIKSIGNRLIEYIETHNILTIGMYPNIYNEIEDRIVLSNVLKYILGEYFKSINILIEKKEKNNLILEKNDIESISRKILVIDQNINRLEFYLNKNLSIDRFIIEMWRCTNENS